MKDISSYQETLEEFEQYIQEDLDNTFDNSYIKITRFRGRFAYLEKHHDISDKQKTKKEELMEKAKELHHRNIQHTIYIFEELEKRSKLFFGMFLLNELTNILDDEIPENTMEETKEKYLQTLQRVSEAYKVFLRELAEKTQGNDKYRRLLYAFIDLTDDFKEPNFEVEIPAVMFIHKKTQLIDEPERKLEKILEIIK